MSTSEHVDSSAPVGPGMVKALRCLEDERQIRNLIFRIGHLADYGEIDEYVDCFTPDGVWEYTEGVNRGAEEIRADRLHRRAVGQQGPGTATRHVVTSLWTEVDGSDVAVAHSYIVHVVGLLVDGVVHSGMDRGTEPRINIVNRYHDTLRRTPDGWKVAYRRIVVAD